MSRHPRSVAELIAMGEEGRRFKYLFFWNHEPERDGRIGRGCLSQWWPAPFELEGRTFATAEHYMMWRKATTFGDELVAAQILSAPHPHQAKSLGRLVAGFDQRTWDEVGPRAVVGANVAKFDQHRELENYLVGTGERVRVEASPRDRTWGIGLAVGDENVGMPERWPGRNLLGFALMEARARLVS